LDGCRFEGSACSARLVRLIRHDRAVAGGDVEAQVKVACGVAVGRERGRASNGDNPIEGGLSQEDPPKIGNSKSPRGLPKRMDVRTRWPGTVSRRPAASQTSGEAQRSELDLLNVKEI